MTHYLDVIKQLSQDLVEAQRPIRILDAIKWPKEVQVAFLATKGNRLPNVTKETYWMRPLNFDPDTKRQEFYVIERSIRRQLGEFSKIGNWMRRLCKEYRAVIRLLEARGTPNFQYVSQELYGSAFDVFYPGAPTLSDLAQLLQPTLTQLQETSYTEDDEKCYSSEDAVVKLSKRLKKYFKMDILVRLADDIIADASAGAECLKIKKDTHFSKRAIRMLEVHEGWVHLGTTLNGLNQPICTFLGKGTPSATVTQEGLAVIMEIIAFVSCPSRLKRTTDRVSSIAMAENGADFMEVFKQYEGYLSPEAAYQATMRVFRGSLPNLGPFTKDLSYTKGFIAIYNYIRLAVQRNLLSRISLLFVGKISLEDIPVVEELVAEGIVKPPQYLPPQFRDLAALSSWMCYSLFLNQLKLDALADQYDALL
jgi:uncharacterized protein (TIGR02421 family)